jgi:anti-sigma regulatory factor (Ser/Thr protein kinase)
VTIPREIAITDDLSVFAARRLAREAASAIGFSKRDCEELVIVASELATNILKHGVSGKMRFEPTEHPEHGRGIAVIATDIGGPIHDWATALRDGHDDRGPIDPARLLKRGGIGAGLGAVIRFTHGLSVEPERAGKRLRAVRYLKRRRRSSRPRY